VLVGRVEHGGRCIGNAARALGQQITHPGKSLGTAELDPEERDVLTDGAKWTERADFTVHPRERRSCPIEISPGAGDTVSAQVILSLE
jgi:hypothetical protein